MRIVVVDAFTARPFRGNPAAVCILDGPRPAPWMQAVAAEMNLSETAFVAARPGGGYDLRWFTPTTEVDLCGHATLASAHVLWETGLAAGPLRFHTRGGVLGAEPADHGVRLDFPAEPAEPVAAPPALAGALGADPRWVGRSRSDYLVEVDDVATVRRIQPDVAALGRLPVRAVIVTAAATEPATAGTLPAGTDFVSRCFAPAVGIDEDPVTGSAHCTLGPYWAARLGRHRLIGYQASARGGTVGVEVAGDRVRLVGRAVTVLVGELQAALEG